MSPKPLSTKPHSSSQVSAGMRFLLYWLPVIALCVAIFWQSSFPSLNTPSLFIHQDKVLHFSAYALLAFLTARALTCEKPNLTKGRIWVIAAVFAALFGLSDETHQAFVPDRTAEIADFLADTLGSVLGAWFYLDFFCSRK